MLRCGVILALCLGAGAAGAHEINRSYTLVSVGDDSLRLSVTLNDLDLRSLVPSLDRNGDQTLWAQEMLDGASEAADTLRKRISLKAAGADLELHQATVEPDLDSEGDLVARFRARAETPARVDRLDLDLSRYLAPLSEDHRILLRIQVPGRPAEAALLSASEPVHRIGLSSWERESLWAQAARFLVLGVEHIFLGYDHVLFLLALIVVGSRLGTLVKIVTAFTVAHSVTLILAALEWVSLPSRLVESGIALSIAYVAAENFWLRRPDHRWILTFFFGFVHGFGFANVLRDLGLPSRGLVTSLLAFNVGVEVGQVAIVALLFPLILWSARRPGHARIVRGLSAVILLFGIGWLVERVLDLDYMPM
ncbi:MAG: HupE/UreJ family protein [Gemmatimonadaceae bacterium]|nr:HupE/UreJ family protein [Gemmatimonadaceae bacterium]